MNIDWTHFTPWSALAGGVLLGVASAAFILLNGRILGISGILGGLLMPLKGDVGWRIAFLLGMACAPTVFGMLFPADMRVAPRIDADDAVLVVAGLLVAGAMALLWRAFCEFYVAIFRISDDLRALRQQADAERAVHRPPAR